jgi:uncharacterized membrane protein HdeD (DUF308 family)
MEVITVTDLSQRPAGLGAISEVRSKWGWFVALGIAFVVLGVIAFLNMFMATIASVFYVGLLMLIGAVAQVFHAFGVKSWGSFFFWLLSGLLYAVAGVVTLRNPLLASVVLTLVLAISLIVGGILRIWAGFSSRPQASWGWIVASGVVTLLAGLVIWRHWPVSSLWILGMFLSIDLMFQGWSDIAFGLALRRQPA